MSCTDHRCTDGITACMGEAGCNGYGVLTMGGRRYRVRGQGRNIGATAKPHERCAGLGLVVCGCTPMADAAAELDAIVAAAAVRDELEAVPA